LASDHRSRKKMTKKVYKRTFPTSKLLLHGKNVRKLSPL